MNQDHVSKYSLGKYSTNFRWVALAVGVSLSTMIFPSILLWKLSQLMIGAGLTMIALHVLSSFRYNNSNSKLTRSTFVLSFERGISLIIWFLAGSVVGMFARSATPSGDYSWTSFFLIIVAVVAGSLVGLLIRTMSKRLTTP